MRFGFQAIGALASLLLVSVPGTTGEKEDQLIDRIVGVYGGEALTEMKTFSFYDQMTRFVFGQSHDPREIDATHYRARVFIDFEADKKEMRFVGGQGEDIYLQHNIFDGARGYRINHAASTITENRGYSFGSVDRRFSLGIDTLLVRLLHDHSGETEYLGTEHIQGDLHDAVKLNASGYPEMRLYFDRETGYLTRMTRPHWRPGTEFAYRYSNHKKQGDIIVAETLYEMKGGKPELLVSARDVAVNPSLETAFELPQGYGQEAATLTFNDMTVQELAPDVYLAGQDWGFSVFYDVGEYFIAVGGYDQLTARLAAVHQHTGTEKPLRYQIVTHHHMDHLGGMREAAELGATFVTHPNNIESIREVSGIEIADDRFMPVEGGVSMEDGKVLLLDLPNGHAAHNIITHIPAAKLVFTADLFVSRQEQGAPKGYPGLVKFKAALENAGFKTEQFVGAHSGRVLSAADLDWAIANQQPPEVCPKSWQICN